MMQSFSKRIGLSLSLAAMTMPAVHGIAMAQQAGEQVTFELRPHCIETAHAAATQEFGGDVPAIEGTTTLTEASALPCPSFDIRDPMSKQTPVLHVGDTLDMDLVLHNPKKLPIARFRTWIAYDSSALDGTSLELSDSFPVPTPGETDFSTSDNYIKISASSEQPVSDETIVLARVTLAVTSAPTNGIVLAFHNPSGTESANTAAFTVTGDAEQNVAATIQGSLAVRTASADARSASSIASSTPSSISSVGSTSSTPSSSPISSSSSSQLSSAQPAAPAVFSKLQVQTLRVTTEGSSAFLAWNPLPSSELAGYNVYYGSISGRYLQRRSVKSDTRTLTIRALPVGVTYYFAIRAVSGNGTESDFSQEVAVTIGNPATSTSPLSGNLLEGPNGNSPDTDGNVAGESGPETWIAMLLVVSAVLGTLFAFRRQWTATSTHTR